MKRKLKALKIIYYILAMLLILSTLTSCAEQEQKPAPSKEEKDEIPKGLTTLEDKAEEITEDIEKLQEEIEKPLEPKKDMEEEKKKEDEKQDEQGNQDSQEGEESKNQGQESQGGQEQDEKQEQILEKEQKIMKMWEDITKKTEELHASWNNYETKAIEDGIDSETIDVFENYLNELTISVENKDIISSLQSLNDLSLNMSKYFDLYKGNPDGEILRLKYYVRQIHIDAVKGLWDNIESIIPNMNEVFERLRQKIKLREDKEKLMNKLNLSVEDLQNSVKDKNVNLVKIKRDIVLKNIEEVQGEAK